MKLFKLLKSELKLTDELLKIKGMKIETKFNKKVAVFDSTLSSMEIEKFVNTLCIFQNAFSFYDKLYPSPSDPGAYISYFRKDNSENWKMTLGNHGWSGGIYDIDKEVIFKQLNNLIHSSQLNEIQIEGVVTFSHYEEKTLEENTKQNKYLSEIHKSPNSFLENSIAYQFHKKNGFPKIDRERQFEILINSDHTIIHNLFPEIKDEPFPLSIVKEYIKISREDFAEYFRKSNYIEKNRKQYLDNTQSDGTWIILTDGKYKLIFQERGNIYGQQAFEERSELEERLISLLYTQYGD